MSHAPSFKNSYADFGFYRSYRQLREAVGRRDAVLEDMRALLEQVKIAERRMESVAGQPIKQMDILEIGPGQGMERATYFGRNNKITSLDTDIIPFGFEPANYVRMLKANGFGRFAKTLGREVVIGRRNRAAWKTLITADTLDRPQRLFGDICDAVPAQNAFDCVMSWSVFEHVADPEQALDHVLAALRPGGIFYISLHLYTCNNGHHDIRSFTSEKEEVPLWGHLRPSTQHLIKPSAYLN
ncbi:MAG TPA: methyltransferase domain-containing protein, partial [Anaerolineae bacterium]|nr:methyltransferase domain-containing protein [Anaerolineae bacterium]